MNTQELALNSAHREEIEAIQVAHREALTLAQSKHDRRIAEMQTANFLQAIRANESRERWHGKWAIVKAENNALRKKLGAEHGEKARLEVELHRARIEMTTIVNFDNCPGLSPADIDWTKIEKAMVENLLGRIVTIEAELGALKKLKSCRLCGVSVEGAKK